MWNSIYEFVVYAASNPWLTVLSSIIAILGFIMAIIFYIKNKKSKSPYYTICSNNIIKDLVSKFDALEMRYSGKLIKNLTVSKIAFWNAGGETIDNDDIVKADPIVIRIKNGFEILDSKIIEMNNETNNFRLEEFEDKSHINIKFDYIDKNNGIVIQLIHTGYSNRDIEFQGRIKEAGKIKFTDLKLFPRKLQAFSALIWVIFLFSLMITSYWILISINDSIFHIQEKIFKLISTMTSIAISFIIIDRGEHYIRKRFSKLPEGLELFNDDQTSKCVGNRGKKQDV